LRGRLLNPYQKTLLEERLAEVKQALARLLGRTENLVKMAEELLRRKRGGNSENDPSLTQEP